MRRRRRVGLRRRAVSVLILAVAAGVSGCGRPVRGGIPSPAAERPLDRATALATFDTVWSKIRATYYDTAFVAGEWVAIRSRLRPRAARSQTVAELRDVLEEMLNRLGDSHVGIVPADVASGWDDPEGPRSVEADAGMEVRLVAGEVVVVRIEPDGAAADAGIRAGWSLRGVNGRPVASRVSALADLPEADRRIARTRLLYRLEADLRGAAGAAMDLALRDANGREVTRTIRLEPRDGQLVRLPGGPPTVAALESERRKVGDECVGIIRFNAWLIPIMPEFGRALDDARGCAGIVVDLRGNPGGIARMIAGVAGHFLSEPATLGLLRTRRTTLHFRANPRLVRPDGTPTRPYGGPLAILTDGLTASTSEFFAAGLQALGRARVFGTRSAGQALPALLMKLPSGDVLMYAIADYTGPTGERIEGRGVIPDEVARIDRRDLLAGRDAALEAAIDWTMDRADTASKPSSPKGNR